MTKRKLPTDVNEQLRQARIQRNWSQQYVADQLGIVVGTVNRWERGKQQPTAYYRLKLCALFGTTAEALGLAEQIPDPVQDKNETQVHAANKDDALNEKPQTIAENSDTITPQPAQIPVATSPLTTQTINLPPSTKNKQNYFTRQKHWHGQIALLLPFVLVLLIIFSTILFSKIFIHQSPSVPTHSQGNTYRTPTHTPSPTSNIGQQLVFDDPLTRNIPENQWSVGTDCFFAHNIFHINSNGTNYCLMGKQTFTNMKYQVEMSLLSGTWAGVVFRANDNSDLYYFSLNTQGQYRVDAISHINKRLLLGSSPAILTGYGKWNVLTVEANNTQLLFWVNGHNVGKIQDATFTNGYVGLCVGYYDNASDPTITTTIFRNALVWQLQK